VTEKVNDNLIFNTFVLCQVFNDFNARKLEKKNIIKGIIAITIVLQVVLVEFFKKFANTERLNWGQWAHALELKYYLDQWVGLSSGYIFHRNHFSAT
jgi:hypothetical protein